MTAAPIEEPTTVTSCVMWSTSATHRAHQLLEACRNTLTHLQLQSSKKVSQVCRQAGDAVSLHALQPAQHTSLCEEKEVRIQHQFRHAHPFGLVAVSMEALVICEEAAVPGDGQIPVP